MQRQGDLCPYQLVLTLAVLLRVSVSSDCCVAGYDVSTKKSYNDTIRKFNKIVGLKYLKGMHINDSKCVPHLLCQHPTPIRMPLPCHVADTVQQAVSMLSSAAKLSNLFGNHGGVGACRAGAPLAAERTGMRTLGAA